MVVARSRCRPISRKYESGGTDFEYMSSSSTASFASCSGGRRSNINGLSAELIICFKKRSSRK
jgi:hypothetical protein